MMEQNAPAQLVLPELEVNANKLVKLMNLWMTMGFATNVQYMK